MNRRSLLQMIGLAPVAAVVTAKAEPSLTIEDRQFLSGLRTPPVWPRSIDGLVPDAYWLTDDGTIYCTTGNRVL